MMNLIITGGSGLIGTHLTNLLVEKGHRVISLTRSPNWQQKREGVDWVGWDACTPEGWGHLVNTSSAIVNLAGEDSSGPNFFPTRWTEKRKKIIRDSRINAGRAVVEAVRMAQRRPSVVVQSSGAGVYGPTGDEMISEEHPFGNTYMARLGQDWEASTQPVEAMGVRRVVIRTGVVLSTQSGALPRMLLPFRLYAGGPLGSGRQYLPWIHPRDVAAAIFFLIQNRDTSGLYNLVAPQTVTNAEFGKTIAKVMHRPYWFPVPGFAMRLAFGEVADVVLTGQRVIPQRLQQAGFKFHYPNLQPALADVLGEPKEEPTDR